MAWHDILLKMLPGRLGRRRPVVAVLPLAGVIGRAAPLRRGLSLAALAGPLDRAFGLRGLRAVALAVNSPGGAPVQAALIHRRIRSLAAEKKVPVFAFAEDVAASGGYWLLCAGDEVYADENAIIGSIGVISAGFGLKGLMDRAGIERRVHTAGPRKAMLDPFLDEDPADVARLEEIQRDVHDSFKALVRERRAGRLKAAEEELFSGEFWTGRRAQALGLVDGLGDLRTVMRARYGERVRLRVIGTERGLRRRLGLSGPAGPSTGPGDWAGQALAAVEERMWWGRYGL